MDPSIDEGEFQQSPQHGVKIINCLKTRHSNPAMTPSGATIDELSDCAICNSKEQATRHLEFITA